ncbi:NUDIX domain-containing protein [Qipengyuania qiaonensis]|uniref:NUDIX domain-containing protein n=1 Tax=Qipengyuania qiaonensis TaxID=2867240 RepID=A0ABS7J8P9_9SPHN|nr:NUDIX domain-containing protein [Qipengyuania qiaonensis]MBX7483636.1 NUDIX domain-containing protein [Qipengyuania qiaonensis]
MLHLIPKPLYRLALQAGHRARHNWRKFRGVKVEGVSVVGRDLKGQILLVRHSYGPKGWYFPGGGIGRKETPEEAARREMREETGCQVEGLTLVGVIEEEISGAPHTAHVFDGMVDAMPRADGREVIEARFFPTHSLPEPLSPLTTARLKLWQARKS